MLLCTYIFFIFVILIFNLKKIYNTKHKNKINSMKKNYKFSNFSMYRTRVLGSTKRNKTYYIAGTRQ